MLGFIKWLMCLEFMGTVDDPLDIILLFFVVMVWLIILFLATVATLSQPLLGLVGFCYVLHKIYLVYKETLDE